MILIFALFSSLCVVVSAGPIRDELKLELRTTSKFSYIWCDAGSGARLDASFYRPICPPSFYPVGDFGWSGGGCPDPSGRQSGVCVRAIQPEALARPLDYEPIWNDAGSGARDNVGMWRPVAPQGFVCLGTVGHGVNYEKPSVNEVRCVAESLTVAAHVGDLIWNDVGSGAKADFSAWQILPDALSGGVYTATFLGVNNYEWPKANVSVIAKGAF